MATPPSAVSPNLPIHSSVHSTSQPWYQWVVDHPIITVAIELVGTLFLYAMIARRRAFRPSDHDIVPARPIEFKLIEGEVNGLNIIRISKQLWKFSDYQNLRVKVKDNKDDCIVERFFDQSAGDTFDVATYLPMHRAPMTLQFNFKFALGGHEESGPTLTPLDSGMGLYQVGKDKTTSVQLVDVEDAQEYEWRPYSEEPLRPRQFCFWEDFKLHVEDWHSGVLFRNYRKDNKIVEIALSHDLCKEQLRERLFYPIIGENAAISLDRMRKDWAAAYKLETGKEVPLDPSHFKFVSVRAYSFREKT